VAVAQGQNPLTALAITLFSALAAVMVGQVLWSDQMLWTDQLAEGLGKPLLPSKSTIMRLVSK
jgi:hypothetical protein